MTFALFIVVPLLAQVSTVERSIPTWNHLSSTAGDLPAPGSSDQQTACLVLDIDKDGLNDIVIASRGNGARLVWYRRQAQNWSVYPIDSGLNLEAGGASADIDGDGDLDLVLGEDFSGRRLFWWENPSPRFDPPKPWARRELRNSGGSMYHDQIFGDFDGDGRVDLAFWVQRFEGLFLAAIPQAPNLSGPWPAVPLLKLPAAEGLAKADIDGDGKVDLIGGGRWFKHQPGLGFQSFLIDEASISSRVAAGQLVESGPPEVAFVNGDAIGRLKWFEHRTGAWIGHDLLGEDVIHGHSLQFEDLNGDGHLDIFCAEMTKWRDKATVPDHPNARMWIFYGNGRGNFVKTVVATGIDNHESRVADLDGDGDPDIVTKPYNNGAPRLDVWLNRGTGPRKNISPRLQ
jgi:FG-GAP-like repeat